VSLDIWLTVDVDTGGPEPVSMTLHDANYTHNVIGMWEKAGAYEALYESAGKMAGEVVEALEKGVADMESKPGEYILLNAKNGWGTYPTALKFLQEFTAACKQHPKAIINVWK
jgi:hypothetical protein